MTKKLPDHPEYLRGIATEIQEAYRAEGYAFTCVALIQLDKYPAEEYSVGGGVWSKAFPENMPDDEKAVASIKAARAMHHCVLDGILSGAVKMHPGIQQLFREAKRSYPPVCSPAHGAPEGGDVYAVTISVRWLEKTFQFDMHAGEPREGTPDVPVRALAFMWLNIAYGQNMPELKEPFLNIIHTVLDDIHGTEEEKPPTCH